MPSLPESNALLAPLQIIMLQDSLTVGNEGTHVEQVEIIFRRHIPTAEMRRAWHTVTTQADVLQMTFAIENGEPSHWLPAQKLGTLETQEPPESWTTWLAADRTRPLLLPTTVPWRAIFWPDDRRFIWTFHHALLDGRSISRILARLLDFLHTGITPARLRLTNWEAPAASWKTAAGATLRKEFQAIPMPPSGSQHSPFLAGAAATAARCLGATIASRLETCAATLKVTVPTVLTWTWGQAIAQASGTAAVAVEQVRCGPPQIGTAGFSMNTLPLVIHRADRRPLPAQLQNFRAHLLAMRAIEALAPYELPAEVIDATRSPWASTIMVERGTLAHTADPQNLTESIRLHESPGECLMAVAYQLPDLRLEVEGRAAEKWLELWVANLAEFCAQTSDDTDPKAPNRQKNALSSLS